MSVATPTKPQFLRRYGGGPVHPAAEQDLRSWKNQFRERDEEQAAFEARQFAAPAFIADDGLDTYEPCDSACAGDSDPGRYDLEGRV